MTEERTVTAEEERAAVVAYLGKGNPYILRDPGLYIRLKYAWAALKSPMALMASGVIVASEEIEAHAHLRGEGE